MNALINFLAWFSLIMAATGLILEIVVIRLPDEIRRHPARYIPKWLQLPLLAYSFFLLKVTGLAMVTVIILTFSTKRIWWATAINFAINCYIVYNEKKFEGKFYVAMLRYVSTILLWLYMIYVIVTLG